MRRHARGCCGFCCCSFVGEANAALKKDGSFDPDKDTVERVPTKKVKNRNKIKTKRIRKRRVSQSVPKGTPPALSDNFLELLDSKSLQAGLSLVNLCHGDF